MSINKTIESIEFFINDLKNNESLYKKGIQKFIGCNISIIELVFIFDKDIQVNEINKGGFSGAKYCITNNILFYLFSMNDYCLYSSYDMKNFYRVENFGIKKKTRKRNFNNSKGDFSFLNKEEIELINNEIKDDILFNYIVSPTYINSKIIDLNDYEVDNIYIYFNEKHRFYIIKRQLYAIKDGVLENIYKSFNTKNEIFSLKILTKQKLVNFRNPKFKNK